MTDFELIAPTAQSLGGLARAKKLSAPERKAIAATAAKARWQRELPTEIRRAVVQGELRLGDLVIPCAVLDDGTRVISERGLGTAFGRERGGSDWRRRAASEEGGELPYFMVAKRLKPFIDNDLDLVGYRRIPYLSLSGGGRDGVGFGTKAELIPNICDVWLKAREAGLLNQRQRAIAEKAEIMLRGLANVGITALVDEATGYQYIRDRDELQKILSAYISPTLLPWTKRFPDEFFQEMFRVYGWQWPPEEGSYGGPKGPRYAGKLIKQIIYGNLPPGVLDELERQNPADSKWQRRTRMTQLLTDTIGHPHVEKLVAVITALFRIADSRQQFWRLYQKAFPKRGDQLEAEV